MGAAWVWARAEWRRRWRGLVALGIGLGLAGAVVLTAAAGSERTGSAYDRLVTRTARHDVQVQDDAEGAPLLARVAGLPGVLTSDRVSVTFLALARNGDRTTDEMILVAGEHDGFGRRFDRPVIQSGRMPDPARPSEVLLNNIGAATLDAKVGDRLTVRALSQEQFSASVFEGRPPDDDERTELTFTVTGIGRLPDDADAPDPAAIVSAQVFEEEDVGRFDNVVWMRLAKGQAGVDDFVAAAEALPEYSAENVSFTLARDADERVIDAIAVQRVGLVVFAVTALLVVAVVGAQALVRQLAASADDDEALLALGMSRRGRLLALALPFVPVAAVAAVVATAGTVASSPLLPVGFAGRIEADKGLYVYPAILGLGLVGLVLLILVVTVTAAGLRTRRRAGGEAGARPSVVASAAAAARAGPATVTGLRLALEPGRGRFRLPVRSTLAGVALGAGGVAAVLTFGASLDRLLTDPVLHGRSWDAALAIGEEDERVDEIVRRLPDSITDAALADQRSVTIADQEVGATSLRALRGRIEVPYLEGRPPRAPDEVAIGPDALKRLNAEVGDTVTARATGGGPVRLEVVGSPLIDIDQEYDRQAIMTVAGLERLERSEGGRNIYVRVNGPPEPTLARLAETIEIDGPVLPTSIGNLREAQGIPDALAEFLAVLAVAAVAHALLLGLRRRRRDLAVLRVLGLRSPQVLGVVAAQATAVTVIGALIGIPLGVAAGRVVWSEFANGLNVVVRTDVPLLAILAGALGLLVIANLVGLPRAWAAKRLAPSAVLRTE